MSAAEEAHFHNKAVEYAQNARDALMNAGESESAQVWAQLSTTYALMAQTALNYRIWLGPIVPPS